MVEVDQKERKNGHGENNVRRTEEKQWRGTLKQTKKPL